MLIQPNGLLIPTTTWGYINQALRAANDRPLVVFDADGTLWSGDVGETLLRTLDSEGLVTAGQQYPTLLDEYAARCELSATDGYTWACTVMAGIDEQALLRACQLTWERHRGCLLEGMRQIVTSMLKSDVEVVVVSASSRWIIEVAVEELGIDGDHVIAFDQDVVDGRLTDMMRHPLPNGLGKAEAINEVLGRRPCLGFGNSVHDLPMLRQAKHAVVVLASADGQQFDAPLQQASHENDWPCLRLD